MTAMKKPYSPPTLVRRGNVIPVTAIVPNPTDND
jgi:hypothetical protein